MRSSLRFSPRDPLLLSVAVLVACSGSDSDPEPPAPQISGIWVEFSDASTGVVVSDVYDSSREIVHFDSIAHAMVDLDGVSVAGWTATDNDLAWDQNTIAFSVLFGSEAGERRAYFTETSTGTICDLKIEGPNQLAISPTSETPPQAP